MSRISSEEYSNNYRRFIIVSQNTVSPIQWAEITELTGRIYSSYHVAIEIDNYIFLHGGIRELKSTKPSNEFHRINMKTHQIDSLTSAESPFLSQHAAVVLCNRYIVLIGGWDGHSRTSDIHIFDLQTLKWLKRPSVEGFPKGAGLSSHTANASLKSHSDWPEIIIIGREGSTRIQRRFGNAYRLTGNRDLTKFVFTELPLDVDSRSGHCTAAINSELYIVGGRDDKVIEIKALKRLISDKPCDIVTKVITNFQTYGLEKCPLAGKRKAGRRGHCLIPGKNGFIITGGSSFIASNHVADAAGFLYSISSVGEHYYFLGSIENARANGAYLISDANEAFYHGGIDTNGKIRSEFLKLKLSGE